MRQAMELGADVVGGTRDVALGRTQRRAVEPLGAQGFVERGTNEFRTEEADAP